MRNKPTDEWGSHADGEHSIAVLRAGHYYGPRCRIFDLYTKPLPAKGPSFDCKTASNLAEEMVCKHPELAALDRAYGARLRDRLLKVPAAERQDAANGYYWDMGIRDNSAMSVKDLAAAYRDALGTDSAQYFAEKQPAQSAHAACEKAHTPSEKTVCANSQLKTLDEQLAQAYHQAFIRTQPNSPERRELIQAQRNWLKTRDTCKADVPCLEQAYRNRIQRLSDHAR
ncbi:lysozyme inhibitor LprI family protein [Acidithiobacillus sp. AC3]